VANKALLQQLRRRAGRYWIAGDDPEDLVQDALLATHNPDGYTLSMYQGEEKPRSLA